MNSRRLIVAVLGLALVVGVVLIVRELRKSQADSTVTKAQPPADSSGIPDHSVPKPIQPVAPPQAKVAPLNLPPGTTVARPGGDPEQPIPPAPRGERILRDHRG